MNLTLKISPAIAGEAIQALLDSAWSCHAPVDTLELLRNGHFYVCAFDGDELVGFAKVITDGGCHGFLLDPTVAPHRQRQGIGKQLVTRCAEEARRRRIEWLHVDYEPHLKPFYQSCGFRASEAGLLHLNEPAQAAFPAHQTTREPPRLENVPREPYPELPSVLCDLVAGIQDELSANLVGVYLVGSLATGDFDLDSDVDFMVVTKQDLTDEAIPSLQAMHARIHSLGCYPAQHLEGSYISQALLNQTEAVGVRPLWYLDNGSTTFERSVHDNQWHVRWVLRERGIGLVGPEATSLLDPVPVEAMRREVAETMRLVVDLFAASLDRPLSFWTSRFGQSFAVLSFCRMLHTLNTGAVQSKLVDMKWAKRSLDPAWAELIQRAWEERRGVRHCIKIGQRADPQALRETLEFAKYAVRESERPGLLVGRRMHT